MFARGETNRNPEDELAATPAPASSGSSDSVTIRRSRPGDGPALGRLARLDDRRLPAGPYVLAERSGEIVAAAPLEGGSTIANPFMPTADLVSLIELRAHQFPT